MSLIKRPSSRAQNQLRDITIERKFTKHAEGSVLITFGDTQVLCTASVETGVPSFLKGKGQGWITAEYGMLPRATNSRMKREAAHGKQSGRTQEIQRLIGRALRSAVDLKALGEISITIDCDVLQADGGTRTASITGACVALYDALQTIPNINISKVFKYWIAAVSVGVFEGSPVLDLDYAEDSNADTDMNIVMNEHLEFIELQGTAENQPLKHEQLSEMIKLASDGIAILIQKQKEAVG